MISALGVMIEHGKTLPVEQCDAFWRSDFGLVLTLGKEQP
jgi:hypothetical protein